MHQYGRANWEELWESLEREGNVGIDRVINPYLYPPITTHLAAHPKSFVVDFGCGTNVMGIELLFGYKELVPALRADNTLDQARFNTLLYLGVEGSEELVKQSNKYLTDIGAPVTVGTVHKHIDASFAGSVESGSVGLCVSRNFLMHLPPGDFEAHMADVARILKPGGQYIFATLTPGYELKKAGRSLENGEQYDFLHGKSGEFGTFIHYFKSADYFDEVVVRDFDIESTQACVPLSDEFKETHERYYDSAAPVAQVYALKVKKQ